MECDRVKVDESKAGRGDGKGKTEVNTSDKSGLMDEFTFANEKGRESLHATVNPCHTDRKDKYKGREKREGIYFNRGKCIVQFKKRKQEVADSENVGINKRGRIR